MKTIYSVIVIVAALAISAWLLVKTDNVTGAELKGIYNAGKNRVRAPFYRPNCPSPLYRTDPGFRACYKPVGDFPEVNLGVKSLTTRMFTAFGAGLAPIL